MNSTPPWSRMRWHPARQPDGLPDIARREARRRYGCDSDACDARLSGRRGCGIAAGAASGRPAEKRMPCPRLSRSNFDSDRWLAASALRHRATRCLIGYAMTPPSITTTAGTRRRRAGAWPDPFVTVDTEFMRETTYLAEALRHPDGQPGRGRRRRCAGAGHRPRAVLQADGQREA